jgi:hypothetical protein
MVLSLAVARKEDYFSRPSSDAKRKLTSVLCAKYGWAENHHLALGIPYFLNDFDINGQVNESEGFGNIYLFEKWNAIRETNTIPGVAFDAWVYLPTGDADRKLGNDNWAFKLTTEVSKAWEHFSLHFNPGYTWGQDSVETDEINVGAIWNLHKEFLPAVEYNYIHTEGLGTCKDVVPGFIWKFAKGWSFKLAAVINVDTTMPEKTRWASWASCSIAGKAAAALKLERDPNEGKDHENNDRFAWRNAPDGLRPVRL